MSQTHHNKDLHMIREKNLTLFVLLNHDYIQGLFDVLQKQMQKLKTQIKSPKWILTILFFCFSWVLHLSTFLFYYYTI